MELRERTAVVTGASTGIGRAIAGKLAEAGCRLGICARNEVPLERAAMVEARDGVVVNIASLAGKHPFRTGSVYAASKHAILGMSGSMMLDLREHGVRVLCVCPGSVDTPFFGKESHRTPSGARVLDAEDVAELVITAIRISDRGTVSEVEIRPIDP